MDETRAVLRNQEASIRNLEVQIGQIAKQLNQSAEKSLNILPSDTIINPREECKAIRVIEVEEAPEVQVEVPKEKPEIIAEIKNQKDDHHPPQSSKKHTRSSSKFLEVLAGLEVNTSAETLERYSGICQIHERASTQKEDSEERKY
ncbi:hypothetical protein PIB30_110964, partial [Stylosanthes scabra]|nr:hypothetical protein [Stylosanthes scabra]